MLLATYVIAMANALCKPATVVGFTTTTGLGVAVGGDVTTTTGFVVGPAVGVAVGAYVGAGVGVTTTVLEGLVGSLVFPLESVMVTFEGAYTLTE